jgi:hypothetical protein
LILLAIIDATKSPLSCGHVGTSGLLGVVALITYQSDVAPHLKRGLMYRRLRIHRWDALHEHDGRATFWWIAIPSLLLFWAAVAYGVHSI